MALTFLDDEEGEPETYPQPGEADPCFLAIVVGVGAKVTGVRRATPSSFDRGRATPRASAEHAHLRRVRRARHAQARLIVGSSTARVA